MKKQTWFFAAIIALLLFILLRKYVFDIRKINNYDMQKTYNYGDALLINKLKNTFVTNDIVYFKFPEKDTSKFTTYLFQRIVGTPGDSIEVINKVVYLNNFEIKDTVTIKHNYFLKSTVKMDSLNRLKYRLMEGTAISEKNDYSFSLTKLKSDSLRNMAVIEKIELEMEKKDNFDFSCFPYSINYKWNMDNYGKLYIPKKNDTLALDTINIVLYKKIIQEYEKNTLEIKRDSIFINNKYTTTYCVKQNYYFTLGDNRDNSNDSRKWGFLPQNYILGKSIWLLKKAKK
ncbi:MAG: signal peptidase I [Bacteroidota bacterium]|nr:signal peptidase I [Bacteroidota bacterium]MDP3147244.1 signal peptidase I [Bacteroidota bacterium]